MKTIELTPEWILSSLPVFFNMDDEKVGVETNNLKDAKWISLALDTLSIQYVGYEYSDIDNVYIGFEFRIDDIKNDCPNLYLALKDKNDENKTIKYI